MAANPAEGRCSDMLGTKREASCVDPSPTLLQSSRAGCMQQGPEPTAGAHGGGTKNGKRTASRVPLLSPTNVLTRPDGA